MPPTNNGSTEDIQPSVVPVVHHESISEPVNAPVSASKPNQKASIPFPSRRNDERRREKANDQIEKFYEIFRDLSFEISFTDALMLMPKFASTLKTLIGNKEKLSEMARTPLNENCSAVILNKLPKPDTEWKNVEKTKSRQKPKSEKVNQSQPRQIQSQKVKKNKFRGQNCQVPNLFNEEYEENACEGLMLPFSQSINHKGHSCQHSKAITHKDHE
ncbi:hypothetical protein Tco_0516448 [Tanacetum coccineum]